MPRIRSIKPDFFRHEQLQDMEKANPGSCVMLVFAGLWGHCDKGGVFEWKPRSLKLDILPFLDFDMAETLALLVQAGLVTRYVADRKEYGAIPTFAVHQRIGGKEAQEPEKHPRSDGEAIVKQQGLQEGKGREKEGNGDAQARATHGLDVRAWDRWLAYRRDTRKPIRPASEEAAAKALAAFGKDQAAVVEQSIAQGWQGLFALKNVPRGAIPSGEDTLRKLMDRRGAIGLEDFRDPCEGETADGYREAQDAEYKRRQSSRAAPKFAADLAARKRVNA